MNNLQIFNNEEFGQIRTVTKDNKTYFAGSDVAKALGYAIPHKAVQTHCKGVLKWNIPTNSGNQDILFITEGDVYRLIMKSKLPNAEKFETWVMEEVLPTIRKTGHYEMSGYTPKATSLGEVVNLIKVTRETMKAQKASPTEIATAVKKICEQFGVELPECFIKPERMTMADAMDMVDFIYSQPKGKGKKQPTYEDYIIYRANKKRLNG